jgi:hypothetical protein
LTTVPSLSHLTRAKPTTATIDLGEGDTVTLTFDANKVTPRWMDEAMQRVQDQDMLSLCKALTEVLSAWDVVDDAGAPVAIELALKELSFPVVNSLFETVCKSAAPASEEGNGSATISSTEPNVSSSTQGSLQNGPSPSMLPEPSASQLQT